MRLCSFGALLAAVAAAVLLALATFGVPIHDSFYLLEVGMSQLHFTFGPFGYSQNGEPSATHLGYDVPSDLGGNQNPISSLVHNLSYVLVVFPIAFALAVVTALSAVLATTCAITMNAVSIFAATLGALLATLAFAMVIAIYFVIKDVLQDMTFELKFGQSFYFTVIGAACLYLAAILSSGGLCCDGWNLRRPRQTHADASYITAPSHEPPRRGQGQAAAGTDLPAFPEYHPTMDSAYEMDDTASYSMYKPYEETALVAPQAPYLSQQPAGSSMHLLAEAPHTGSSTQWLAETPYAPTEQAYVDAPEAPAAPAAPPPPVSEQQAAAWFLPEGAPPSYPPSHARSAFPNDKRR